MASTSNPAPSTKRPLETETTRSGDEAQRDRKRQAVRNGASSPSAATTESNETSTQNSDVKTATQPIPSTANHQVLKSAANGNHTQSVDESGWLHLRAVVTSAEAATIIGKGGDNVATIRRLSGAKCSVSEYSRGAIERILTISGPVDGIAKAFGLIVRTINSEPMEETSTPQSRTYQLRLLVPHVLVGAVIGKAGARIKDIQEQSGARLNVSEQCLALSGERTANIIGVADAVHIAAYYVGQALMDQYNERYGGPASSAYANRSGGPAGAGPGGLQVVPYQPQAMGGQFGHPDNYRRHTNLAVKTPANPYGIAYLHGQAPAPQQAAPQHFNGGPSFQGAGPQPMPNMNIAVANSAPNPAMAGPPQQPMLPNQPLTQQIFIPNDMVGAIIGKGGAKINEIRQISGSVIKINEPQDNSNERLVTITGTQECNQMALYMLYSRLESEKHRV